MRPRGVGLPAPARTNGKRARMERLRARAAYRGRAALAAGRCAVWSRLRRPVSLRCAARCWGRLRRPHPGARMDAAALGGGPGLLLLLGLAVFSCVGASWNGTADYGAKGFLCSSPENCTENITQFRMRGHFSKCPEEYKHYCVKGKCRYVTVEETPSCICEKGYTGARCEHVDIFYLRGHEGQMVVVCLIVAMVVLIALVICICTCSHHHRKQRRRRKEEEMETLQKDLPPKPEDVLETDIA